jgi:hypothetical protein
MEHTHIHIHEDTHREIPVYTKTSYKSKIREGALATEGEREHNKYLQVFISRVPCKHIWFEVVLFAT